MKRTTFNVLLYIIVYVTRRSCGLYWPVFPSFFQADSTLSDEFKRGYSSCPSCVYETKWFEQNVDHFTFVNNATFKQRYLINKSHWKPGGPIFFYCGNEADIEYFARTMGFLWEAAPDFDAMLVFAEQRYQGRSLPFGAKSLTVPKYTGYLTSSQVLADYSKLINFVKSNIAGAKDSPVVAFGGSLGGQYASWLRMKYPSVIAGAIASSAPVFQFSTDCGTQYSLVTRAFEKDGGRACVEVIRKSWDILGRLAVNRKGRAFITKTFSLCEPLRKFEDVYQIRDKLALSYLFLAMENYPHATNTKPAWPIKAVCSSIKNVEKDERKLITDLANGLSVYFNHSKSLKCLRLAKNGKELLGAWNYQSCTELLYPLCSDGIRDMFYKSSWNVKSMEGICERTWGAKPDLGRVKLQYGDRDISEHSNIVFSNGDMDPWSGGGVLHDISDSIVAINIERGAHNSDLLFAHEQDLASVKAAREQEKFHIQVWIKKWKEKLMRVKQLDNALI
jgi:lysosomal Pro-X carboxypeptidase